MAGRYTGLVNFNYTGDKRKAAKLEMFARGLIKKEFTRARAESGRTQMSRYYTYPDGVTIRIKISFKVILCTIYVPVEEIELNVPEEALFLWTPIVGYPQVMIYKNSKNELQLKEVSYVAGEYASQFHETLLVSFGKIDGNDLKYYAHLSFKYVDDFQFYCGGYVLVDFVSGFYPIGAGIVENKMFCFITRNGAALEFYSYPIVDIDYTSTDYINPIINVADLTLVYTTTLPSTSIDISTANFDDTGTMCLISIYGLGNTPYSENIYTLSIVGTSLNVSVSTTDTLNFITQRSTAFLAPISGADELVILNTGVPQYDMQTKYYASVDNFDENTEELNEKRVFANGLTRDGTIKIAYVFNTNFSETYQWPGVQPEGYDKAYVYRKGTSDCGDTRFVAETMNQLLLSTPGATLGGWGNAYGAGVKSWYNLFYNQEKSMYFSFPFGDFTDDYRFEYKLTLWAEEVYRFEYYHVSCPIGRTYVTTRSNTQNPFDPHPEGFEDSVLEEADNRQIPVQFSMRHDIAIFSTYKTHSLRRGPIDPPPIETTGILWNPEYPIVNKVNGGSYYYSFVVGNKKSDVVGLDKYKGNFPLESEKYPAPRFSGVDPYDGTYSLIRDPIASKADGAYIATRDTLKSGDGYDPVYYKVGRGDKGDCYFIEHTKPYILYSMSDRFLQARKDVVPSKYNVCCLIYDIEDDKHIDLVNLYNDFLTTRKLPNTKLKREYSSITDNLIADSGILHIVPDFNK